MRIRDNSHVELATLRSRACVGYRPGRFQGLEGPAHGVIAQLEVLGHGLDGHARVALEGRDDKRQGLDGKISLRTDGAAFDCTETVARWVRPMGSKYRLDSTQAPIS